MKRTIAVASAMLGLTLANPPARGQGADSALKDRVAQLVERLGGPKDDAKAAAAEKSLTDLGPRVLPLLPAEAPKGKPELAARLDKIRQALREKEEQVNLGPSKVTLKGTGIRLTEAIKALAAQTGNAIVDTREAEGMEVTNPAVDLDLDDKTFFEALDIVCEKAGVGFTPYTGDGTIGLTAGPGEPTPGMPARGKPLIQYAGPYRIEFKQLAIVRDFAMPAGTATATFEVLWEPRLRPMLLSIKNEGVTIKDDQGKAVAPQVQEQSDEAALRAGNCAAEVNLTLQAPERTAKVLSSLQVKGSVTVPAGMRTFRFPSLEGRNVAQKQGDITVTLEETEVDQQIWKVALAVSYPEGGGPAFESYRQGLFNNRTWLQKADGGRFEQNGGFNNAGSDGGTMRFEYLFVDAPGKPGDHGLIYETPVKVVPIPLEFEFKDVPIP